jgi:FkbM family methyltransferase
LTWLQIQLIPSRELALPSVQWGSGTVINPAKSLLKKVGLYGRLKGSALRDYYWRIADRRIIDQREREVGFYRHLLTGYQAGDLIFDIGANHGSKTDIFLRLGARVVAVDPDKANSEFLRQRFLDYRIRKKPLVVVDKAVSDNQGVETIWIDAPGSAKNSLSRKWVDTLRKDERRFGQRFDFSRERRVETVTLEHLITVYGLPFFIKIDVEGYEANVLRGLRRPVRFVSFEVNLPEFRQEGMECIELLDRIAERGQFNFATDCCEGLAMERWLGRNEFAEVLRDRREKCIEAFWRLFRPEPGQPN